MKTNVEGVLNSDLLRYGRLGDVYIPRERGSGEHRGFAFVRFVNKLVYASESARYFTGSQICYGFQMDHARLCKTAGTSMFHLSGTTLRMQLTRWMGAPSKAGSSECSWQSKLINIDFLILILSNETPKYLNFASFFMMFINRDSIQFEVQTRLFIEDCNVEKEICQYGQGWRDFSTLSHPFFTIT